MRTLVTSFASTWLFVLGLSLSGCAGPPAAPPPRTADARGATDAAATCRSGAVLSCDALAEQWSHREFVAGDAAPGMAAAAALQEACDAKGVSSACLAYAQMRKSGTATGKPDGEGAKAYFGKLKALGDLNGFRGEAKSSLGVEALTATTKACEGGRARACGQLGWAAYNGVQRDKSIKDAYVAYEKACTLGSGNGCRWAGHFATTYPDETAAADSTRTLLLRGCDTLGNAGACDELGLYQTKRGDAASAEPLYARACENGSRTGCMHLGEVLTARGEPKGQDLMKRACDAGEEAACKQLAK